MPIETLLEKIQNHSSSPLSPNKRTLFIAQLAEECSNYTPHEFVQIVKASFAIDLFNDQDLKQDTSLLTQAQSKQLQGAYTQALAKAPAKDLGILIETSHQLKILRSLSSVSPLLVRIEAGAPYFSASQVFCALELTCQSNKPLPDSLTLALSKHIRTFSSPQLQNIASLLAQSKQSVQLDLATKEALLNAHKHDIVARTDSSRRTLSLFTRIGFPNPLPNWLVRQFNHTLVQDSTPPFALSIDTLGASGLHWSQLTAAAQNHVVARLISTAPSQSAATNQRHYDILVNMGARLPPDTYTYLQKRPQSPARLAFIATGIAAIVAIPLYIFTPLLSLVINFVLTPLALFPTPIDNALPLLRFFPILLKTPFLVISSLAPIILPALLVGLVTFAVAKHTRPAYQKSVEDDLLVLEKPNLDSLDNFGSQYSVFQLILITFFSTFAVLFICSSALEAIAFWLATSWTPVSLMLEQVGPLAFGHLIVAMLSLPVLVFFSILGSSSLCAGVAYLLERGNVLLSSNRTTTIDYRPPAKKKEDSVAAPVREKDGSDTESTPEEQPDPDHSASRSPSHPPDHKP